MNLWLVIPVKPFDEGKTRLAGTLPPHDRTALMRELLTGVLLQVGESGHLAGTLVISRDDDVLTLADKLGAQTMHESGLALNTALNEARSRVVNLGGDGLLVLPADLPLLTADDVLELYELALSDVEVAIAPSHDGGTNALLLRPPDVIDFAFGPHSYRKHLQQAIRKNLRYAVYRSETLGRDLDLPEDLALVAE